MPGISHAVHVPFTPYDLALEQQMLTAPRQRTGHLFHYTSAATAIDHILPNGTLRLSPYEGMNDLWESQPHYPVISTHHDDEGMTWGQDLWSEIDRELRLHTKMSCLTLDYALPDHVETPSAFRGWAHLALWAHYGDGHRGVCLRFDADKLIKVFDRHAATGVLAFHGPVMYTPRQARPVTIGIDPGQLKEFGVDAVARAYAQRHPDQLFFRKHLDWANESEYRLVLLNESTGFEDIDVRDALTGVVVGSRFPEASLPGLLSALEDCPGVALEQVRYLDRSWFTTPFEGLPVSTGVAPALGKCTPRRNGSAAERFAALSRAEAEAAVRKEEGEAATADLVVALEHGLSELAAALEPLPEATATLYPRVMAVPAPQRARRAGVPGERIHFERGYMCVVENQPVLSHTLVAAAALQVLDGKRLRLHAVVTTEDGDGDRIERGEPWRAMEEVALPEAPATLTRLLENLLAATQEERARFDERRSSS